MARILETEGSKMTEEELRKKIDTQIDFLMAETFDSMGIVQLSNVRIMLVAKLKIECSNRIVAIVKEAGWIDPTDERVSI